ncbi:unnamed protein product [Linum trigynum]|uniref:Uncharacterized protein n=1 Tax=Linum trigynum TaxID=586398 RepID=A0AAV2FMF0_9ROSI
MLFLVPICEMAQIQSKLLVRQGSLAGSCLRRWRRDGSAGSGELLATVATGWKRRERGAACYNKDWRWRLGMAMPSGSADAGTRGVDGRFHDWPFLFFLG